MGFVPSQNEMREESARQFKSEFDRGYQAGVKAGKKTLHDAVHEAKKRGEENGVAAQRAAILAGLKALQATYAQRGARMPESANELQVVIMYLEQGAWTP